MKNNRKEDMSKAYPLFLLKIQSYDMINTQIWMETGQPVISGVSEDFHRHKGLIFEVLEIIPVLLAGEAGTVFVDTFEFAVAHDFGLGIVDLQGAEQGDEGSALLGGTGVGRLPMLV